MSILITYLGEREREREERGRWSRIQRHLTAAGGHHPICPPGATAWFPEMDGLMNDEDDDGRGGAGWWAWEKATPASLSPSPNSTLLIDEINRKSASEMCRQFHHCYQGFGYILILCLFAILQSVGFIKGHHCSQHGSHDPSSSSSSSSSVDFLLPPNCQVGVGSRRQLASSFVLFGAVLGVSYWGVGADTAAGTSFPAPSLGTLGNNHSPATLRKNWEMEVEGEGKERGGGFERTCKKVRR